MATLACTVQQLGMYIAQSAPNKITHHEQQDNQESHDSEDTHDNNDAVRHKDSPLRAHVDTERPPKGYAALTRSDGDNTGTTNTQHKRDSD